MGSQGIGYLGIFGYSQSGVFGTIYFDSHDKGLFRGIKMGNLGRFGLGKMVRGISESTHLYPFN